MRRHFPPIVFCLVVLIIGIITMPHEEYRADPMSIRCETVNIINNHSLEIPEDIAGKFGERGQYFFQNNAKEKWYCKYGILNSLLYIPSLWVEKLREGKLDYLSPAHIIYLNVFNIIFTLFTAIYFYLLASRYTKSLPVLIIFLFTSFYCTFWWYYFRAQNSEIYQTLFLIAFFYHVTSALTPTGSATFIAEIQMPNGKWKPLAPTGSATFLAPGAWRQLLLASGYLGLLVLVKAFFFLIFPLTGLWLLLYEWLWFRSQSGLNYWKLNRFWILWYSIPLVCAMLILLAVNNYKFGSPFDNGYDQWKLNGRSLFSGNFVEGFTGFLFNKQFNMFFAYPIFIFAFFGYRRFFREHRPDLVLFSTMGVLLLLIYSKFLVWSGQWCYGPRYLLPVLPLASLPFICTLEWLFKNVSASSSQAAAPTQPAKPTPKSGKPAKAAIQSPQSDPNIAALLLKSKKNQSVLALAAMAIILSISFKLQLNVNALPFFVYFEMQGLFSQLHDPQIDKYFNDNTFGSINGDLLAYKRGEELAFPPFAMASQKLNPNVVNNLRLILRQMAFSNYYFRPDPAPGSTLMGTGRTGNE